MPKSYALCPGKIVSKTDGDMHYIPFDQLARLYKVRPRECEIIRWSDPLRQRKINEAARKGQQILMPRYDGNYPLFKD